MLRKGIFPLEVTSARQIQIYSLDYGKVFWKAWCFLLTVLQTSSLRAIIFPFIPLFENYPLFRTTFLTLFHLFLLVPLGLDPCPLSPYIRTSYCNYCLLFYPEMETELSSQTLITIRLHGVTSQKTTKCISDAILQPNPTETDACKLFNPKFHWPCYQLITTMNILLKIYRVSQEERSIFWRSYYRSF
jgi:hypothetical protein